MIQSVMIADDAEIIQTILRLHRAGRRVLDATFGHGGFWRLPDIEPYQVTGIDLRMDSGELEIGRVPEGITLAAGDYRRLEFEAASFDVIVLDPPFMADRSSTGRIKARYTAPVSYEELLRSLQGAKAECARVLTDKGIVIIKSMDYTEGRRRRWFSRDVANMWDSLPFRLDDQIVKVAMSNMRTTNIKRQERTKSAHTFFQVYRLIHRVHRNGKITDPEKLEGVCKRSTTLALHM